MNKQTSLELPKPESFGIEEVKAQQIKAIFTPMLDQMANLEKEANKVFEMDPATPEARIAARDIRLQLVKVRTGTKKLHEEQKSFYLAAGRFIDGFKNTQKFAGEGLESRLKDIEEHEVRMREQEIVKLQEERSEKLALLEGYDQASTPDSLGSMEENVWANFYAGTKANLAEKIEAERKAEEQRLEQERLNKLQHERFSELAQWAAHIDDWSNVSLSLSTLTDEQFQELKSKAIQHKKEADAWVLAKEKENARLKKEAEEREAREKVEAEKRQKEKEEAERKQKELEDKLAKEEEERRRRDEEERLRREREEQAIKDEAIRQEKERLEAEEAEKRKGDADKVADLKADLKALIGKYQMKSKANKTLVADIEVLVMGAINKIEEHE